MTERLEVKLEANDTRESLLEQKALAEMSLLTISTKYHLVWISLQSSPDARELEEIKSLYLDVPLKQPLPPEIQANSQAHLNFLTENTQRLTPKFNEFLNNLSQQTGVRIIYTQHKPTKRVWEKALFDYGNDLSRVVDVGRGSAIAINIQMLVIASHWILKNCDVVRMKNRFGDAHNQLVSRGGYMDVLFNIKIEGFIFELQLHLDALAILSEENQKVLRVARSSLETTIHKLTTIDKEQTPDQLIARIKALEAENGSLKAQNLLQSGDIIRSLKSEIENLEAEVSELRLKLSMTPRRQPVVETRAQPMPPATKRILTTGSKFGFGVIQPAPTTENWEEFVDYAKKNLTRADCQYGLAWCLTNGKGTIQREHEAVYLFRLASEQNFAPAQCSLGSCYLNGTGVVKDEQEAVRLYRLASEQDYAPAQCSLGSCYQHGTGVPRNEREAIRLYQMAVEQNYAPAQCSLGVCYHSGTGVAQSYQEAMKLYQLSADQNFANAQYNLGVYYQTGTGLTKNEEEAFRLYQLAADQGFVHAQYALGVCYSNGAGVQKNDEEAVHYYRLAANNNHTLALHALGTCLRSGVGVEKNEVEGNRLLRLARRQA